MTGLEASDTQVDFAEYRPSSTKPQGGGDLPQPHTQHCNLDNYCLLFSSAACQLLATLTVEGLATMSTSPPPSPLCTNLRLFNC